MDAWINIIKKPETPDRRLAMLIAALNDINNDYDRMFYFDDSFNAVFNTGFQNIRMPKFSSSIVNSPQPSYIGRDKNLTVMEKNLQDFCLVYATLRYFNADLSKEERAVIASKYFRACKRQTVLDRLDMTRRDYYDTLETAQEKLIELWRLDTCGGPEELGIPLSRMVVDQRRTARTGIKNGYLGQCPDWDMQFFKK